MSKILATAEKLSWPKGTAKSKYAYKGGKPTSAYKVAAKKAFPKASIKKHANCDRAAATVAITAGMGKMPPGNKEQLKWKPKKMSRKGRKNVRPIDVAKPGDIIIYQKSNGKRHTLILAKEGLYEAQHEKTYLHWNKSQKKLKAKRPKVVVLREK